MLGRNDPCPRIRPRPSAPPAGTQPDRLAPAHGKCLRYRSAPQHLAAFGAAVAVLETGIDRIDPRAGTFLFGVAVWVFAAAWGIAVCRGRLVPTPVGTPLSGAGALAGAIIAMDQSAGVLLAITTVAGLFAGGVWMDQVPLIGIGAAGTLYVVPDAAARYLPGSAAAPLAVAAVGLVLLGVALWLARQRTKDPAGHAANGHRGPDGRQRG